MRDFDTDSNMRDGNGVEGGKGREDRWGIWDRL